MTTFSAKLIFIPSGTEPDEYDPENGRMPDDSFVVTRNLCGEAQSRYGDFQWDRTAYDPERRSCILYFSFWDAASSMTSSREKLAREMRWLIFILIYLRPTSALSNRSLQHYLRDLRSVARFCEQAQVTISHLFENLSLFAEYLSDSKERRNVLALLELLRFLGSDVVGFSTVSRDELDGLKKLAASYRKGLKQHPPIPTRIFSSILATLAVRLTQFNTCLDAVLQLAEECYADPCVGTGKTMQKRIRRKRGLNFDGFKPNFQSLVDKYGLAPFWSANGYSVNRQGLSALLTHMQLFASLQILAYTGMRFNEVTSLPADCLEEVGRDGVKYSIVNGRVTKLTKGKMKRVQWVTSSSGRDAVRIAQRISDVIYNGTCFNSHENQRLTDRRFLFISTNYFAEDGTNTPVELKLSRFPELHSMLFPIITHDDLVELTLVDPDRAWHAEAKFQKGKAWPLTSHQFRRSLALYAQRSGLVSLPSLKRQLHHITLAMAMYYARGSAFANDFIVRTSKEKHFGEEWQETQPVSQYLSYAANVLAGDASDLFGGHIHWMRTRLRSGNGILLEGRAETLKRFRKGELAYTPTPVGGCVNPRRCDKNPIDVLHVSCVAENCQHLVGNIEKTERVVMIKGREIEHLRNSETALPELIHEVTEYRKLLEGLAVAKDSLQRTRSV